MPGADPARIRRLRSQATDVISASNTGDIAGSRAATLRMNASIGRYTRELNAAAASLRAAMSRGGPSLPIRGGAQVAGSPAYMDRLARLGGPRESIRGRKNLEGSPAYIEEQSRQLQRAINAGGPRESIRGRKNLGGSPAAVTEGTRRLNAARKAAENAAAKRVAIQATLEGRAFDDRLKESDSLARKEINQIKTEGKEAGKTFGQRLQNRVKARRLEAKGQKDLSAATQAAQGATAKAITTQATLEGRAFDDNLKESNTLAKQEIKRAKADNRDAGRDFSQRLQNRAKTKQLEAKGLENLSAATRSAQSASTSAAVTQAGINAKPFDDRLKASAEATRKEAKQFDTQNKEAGRTFERRLQNRVDAGKNLSAATQAAQVAATKTAAVQAALDDKTFKNKLDKINQLAKAELKQIKDSDKADLKAFDDRLKNRTAKKKQDKQNAFFQGDARSAIGDALIGGAFPALFGQGLGASAGGALGGGLGGALGGSFGFGLSLVGTAVGQVIDTTAKNLTDLASALKTPGDTMEALAKSGFHVSNSLKFQVQQLESVGRAYDAQTLVLQEVEKRLGPGSVRQLNALESEQRRLQEQWSSIAGTLQSELLPALVGFTGVIADTINVARGINTLPGAKQIGSALRGQGIGGAILTAANPLGGATSLFDKLQRRGKAVAAGPAGNRQAAKPQDEFAAGTARVQESRKLADQIQSAYREAFSLQRQAHDLQRDGAKLNKDIADYSYKKEREIFDLRQQAAEKQIENNRARAQNRIESSDLNARQTFAAAVGFEQQLLANVREVVRSRKEGEADIEQSRNRLELAMAKLNRDVEDYKRTNAREIEDIEQRKLSYVRSVEDYKMKVADHVRDRAREAADLMRQAMTLPGMGTTAAPGGSTRTGVVGGVGNMLPGTKGGPNINEGVGYGRGRLHAGRDLGLDVGDPIHARRAGTVTQSYPSGFGKVGGAVVIRYDDGMQGTYGHTTPGVRQGQKVEAGQRIATVTTDPNPRNTHLHYELRDQLGKLLEPLAYVLASIKAPAGAASNIQGQAATQISNIPGPKFSPVPIGPTPSIAPVNAANLAARLQLAGGEKEAQQILEEQNKLKQKGIELGQIEQILQASQLPQLKQQEDTLKQQIEARQKILDLSDSAASVADIEAESRARITQLELDRSNALAKIKKQYGDDPALTGMVNKRADLAVGVAKNEEKQRRINLDLNNKLQNQERARSAILQLQETLATGKAEAAALERGKLQASNVELLKASELYQLASEAEKTKLALLTAQTEELGKQNEFRKRINEIRNEARFTGAGLRAGMIGAPARAFEEEMKRSGNIDRATGLANETKLLENQQLVWGNLEKNIVATSDAISGALTNGLASIVDGSREIEDVGRDMLKAISSSFADSAQQQLTTLLQRQMGGLFQAIASQGLLSGLGGAGAGGLGGGLGAALSGSLGNIGSAFSAPTFGGFMAKGGITKPGEVYVTGEKEPEFFFPGVTGRVVPRSDMQKAEALRNSGNESDSLDISYTVREERGERYVTEDQLRKSNAMVERRAFAKTINGMKNNGALRDSINI
jgi:murein DD-endopeptidase MepM/ murein hydrolase activator NlpD